MCDVVGMAAGVPTFYQVMQVLALGLVCVAGWKAGWTYAPPNHAMWKVLARSYQPGSGETEEDETHRLQHGGSSVRSRRRGLSSGVEGNSGRLPTLEESGTRLDSVVTEGGASAKSLEEEGGEGSPTTPKEVSAARARGMQNVLMGGANASPSPPSKKSTSTAAADDSGGSGGGGSSTTGSGGSDGGGGGGDENKIEAAAAEEEEARDTVGEALPRISRVSVSSIDLEANNAHLESHPLPPTPLKKINIPPKSSV